MDWQKKIVWISEYFPETKCSGRRVKVELDLSNYATKADFKNATGVDRILLKNDLKPKQNIYYY